MLAVNIRSLHLHCSSIRVSRALRTVRNGTPSQKDYVNLVLEDASPQFLCSVDTSVPSKYGDSATFADAAAILPATLKTLRCDDDGGISVILEAELSRTAEALGGVSLLLRATCAQEPDHDGNNALLRYKEMVDVMTGERCDVVCLVSLKCALKFLLPVDAFAIFHVTKKSRMDRAQHCLQRKYTSLLSKKPLKKQRLSSHRRLRPALESSICDVP